MSKSTISLLLAALATVFAACQKEDATIGSGNVEEYSASSDSQSRLVSYELKYCVPAKETYDELLNDFEEIEAPIFIDVDLEEAGIQLKAYRIVYKSVDVKGDTITLSGDISYIDCELADKRILESVSLFHPAFATTEEHCCEYEQYAFIGRAIHNALVVYPHYQGFFAGKDLPITVHESLLKARQAIDCEIAALELVEKLEDVSMMPGYYTENMGISNGANTTLATHYLLENDEEMIKVNRDWIHLRSTYCCEGSYKCSELITYFVNDFPYEDLQDVEDFSQIAFLAQVVGTYDTWKGMDDGQGSEYFAGIDDVKEYFNQDYLVIEGQDILKLFRDKQLDHHTRLFKNNGITSKMLMNPSFLKEDGTLDEENFYIKALYAAMANNEVIASGWYPKVPLTISHSTDDELVPYSQAASVYKSLSVCGLNPMVELNTIFGLQHTDANEFYSIRDLILKKHPGN